MPWPAHIVAKSSRLLDTETIENKFYGVYNSILHECFPPSQFTVTPQYITAEAQAGGTGGTNSAISYVIEPLDLDSPIFFIEIKPPTHLPSMSARKAADSQVRTRFVQLAHLVQIPRLYGVSAIGRQLCYYTYERASGAIQPVALADSTSFVADTAPIERWNTNIMEEHGHVLFMMIVKEIKGMVRELGYGSM